MPLSIYKMKLNEVIMEKSRSAVSRKQETISQAETLEKNWNIALSIFRSKVEALESALAALGLAIPDDNSASVRKTGRDETVWVHEDKLRVDLIAVPTSGKFKFLTFRGYTPRGNGKNDERLRDKAANLESVLKEATGLISLSINPNSLEVREEEGGRTSFKRVMISLWI